jgi:hypothetical protein
MQEPRADWTMEWFDDPREADELDRARLRAMSPQERYDLFLDLLDRWGHVREREFVRVLEIVELE